MSTAPVARLCIAALVLASAPAFASENIAVIATGLEAQAQLEEVFCVSQQCVAPEKVLSGGKLDSKKLDREDVKYTVVARREGKGIEVQLTDRSGKVRYEEQLEAAAGGKLSVGPLVTLAAKVIDSIENNSTTPAVEQQKPAKNIAAMRAWAARQKLAKQQKANAKKKFAARGTKRSGRG